MKGFAIGFLVGVALLFLVGIANNIFRREYLTGVVLMFLFLCAAIGWAF